MVWDKSAPRMCFRSRCFNDGRNVTFRAGVRWAKEYDDGHRRVVMLDAKGLPFSHARIEEVLYCPLYRVPQEALVLAGHTLQSLQATLAEEYETTFDVTAMVTVVFFSQE